MFWIRAENECDDYYPMLPTLDEKVSFSHSSFIYESFFSQFSDNTCDLIPWHGLAIAEIIFETFVWKPKEVFLRITTAALHCSRFGWTCKWSERGNEVNVNRSEVKTIFTRIRNFRKFNYFKHAFDCSAMASRRQAAWLSLHTIVMMHASSEPH